MCCQSTMKSFITTFTQYIHQNWKLLLWTSNGQLSTKLNDKRDNFDFRIVNFPYISSNIPESTVYDAYISQSIRYARACTLYTDFICRGRALTQKLLTEGYVNNNWKFIPGNSSVATLTSFALIKFHSHSYWVMWAFHDFYWIWPVANLVSGLA